MRDWLFVDDHCRGMVLGVEKGRPGETYNIGGGRELSNWELAEQFLVATGRDWSYVDHIFDPRGARHDLKYSVDYSKTSALGYAPAMTFEDGLAATVAWYRENRRWWEPLKAVASTALSSPARCGPTMTRWLIAGGTGLPPLFWSASMLHSLLGVGFDQDQGLRSVAVALHQGLPVAAGAGETGC